MEFVREKCTTLVMKSRKRHMTEGMELPNHEKIRTLGQKETYKYFGILEAETIKQEEMKECTGRCTITITICTPLQVLLGLDEPVGERPDPINFSHLYD